MKTRIVSILLAVLMLLPALPLEAAAADLQEVEILEAEEIEEMEETEETEEVEIPQEAQEPEEAEAPQAEPEIPEETQAAPVIVTGTDDSEDTDLFYSYVLREAEEIVSPRRFSGSRPAHAPNNTAGNRLSGSARELYGLMKAKVEDIAANGGDTKDLELPLTVHDEITPDSAGLTLDEFQSEMYDLVDQSADQMMRRSVNALLQDCPYDLYWFHKLRWGYSYSFHWDWENGYCVRLYVTKITFDMPVSADYYDKSNDVWEDWGDEDAPKIYHFRVDPDLAQGTKTAVRNATAVVTANASKSDYQKLVAYRDYICDAVEYDNDAWADGQAIKPYGDPWQLIHTFDGDPTTNIVCEGYAKSFKLLCDLSNFRSSLITAYTVMGTVNGGNHMWNIVTMDDGRNYHVDVTWCDIEGAPVSLRGYLFLKGSTNGGVTGYTFNYSVSGGGYYVSGPTAYLYDQGDINPGITQAEVLGTDILTLASSDYTPPAADTLVGLAVTTPPAKVTYTAFQTFSTSGMVVTASYYDGSTSTVTGYTVSYPNGGSSFRYGDTYVTVSYTKDGITMRAVTPVSVSKAAQTFTRSQTAASVTVGGNTLNIGNLFAISNTESGAGLSYAITGTDPTGSSLSGGVLTAGNTAGALQVKVTAAATANYASASKTLTVTVADKTAATVSLSGVPVGLSYGDSSFTLTASTLSSITDAVWTWTSSDETVLKVTGSGASATVQVGVPGTATVSATFQSALYKGGNSVILTVGKKAIVPTVSGISARTYTGSPMTPSVTVKYGTKTLVQGTDYAVTYEDNTDAGTATAVITALSGSYYSFAAQRKTFTINPKSLSGGSVVKPSGYIYYSGQPQEPVPTVKLSGKVLERDKDYTLSWSDNVDVGTGTITVTGKGNYTGTLTASFTILSNASTVTLSQSAVDSLSRPYDGKAYGILASNITVKGSAGDVTVAYFTDEACTVPTTVSGSGASETGGIPVNAGTYWVKATLAPDETFAGAETTASFTVTPLSLKSATVGTISNRLYTGSAQEPLPYVTYGGTALVRNRDYTLSYRNNTAVGTATVVVTGMGNYTDSATKTFRILSNESTVSLKASALAALNRTYDGTAMALTASDVTATGSSGAITVAYYTDEACTVPTGEESGAGTEGGAPVNAGTYRVKVTLEAANGYTAAETVETFTVSPRDISGGSMEPISGRNWYYNQPRTCYPTILWDGETLVQDRDYTLTFSDNTAVGTATVVATGTGNYTGSITGHYEIYLVDPHVRINADLLKRLNRTYTGTAVSISASGAVSTSSWKGQVTVACYKDPECTVLTDEEDGASAPGGSPVNAGTYYIRGHVTAAEYYSEGEAVESFTIAPVSLEDCTVTVTGTYRYTGQPITPTVTVKKGTNTVKSGVYTLAYSDNLEPGTATVTVSAANGNYTGSASGTFAIAKGKNVIRQKAGVRTYKYYDGQPLNVTAQDFVADADTGEITLTGWYLDYDCTEPTTPENSGALTVGGAPSEDSRDHYYYYLRLECPGDDRYEPTVYVTSAHIYHKIMSRSTVSEIPTQFYKGKPVTPSFTVTGEDGTVLEEGVDYEVEYYQNEQTGEALAIANGIGHYDGSAARAFLITRASEITAVEAEEDKVSLEIYCQEETPGWALCAYYDARGCYIGCDWVAFDPGQTVEASFTPPEEAAAYRILAIDRSFAPLTQSPAAALAP